MHTAARLLERLVDLGVWFGLGCTSIHITVGMSNATFLCDVLLTFGQFSCCNFMTIKTATNDSDETRVPSNNVKTAEAQGGWYLGTKRWTTGA